MEIVGGLDLFQNRITLFPSKSIYHVYISFGYVILSIRIHRSETQRWKSKST